MNKKELLKLAKERVDTLLKSQKEQEQEETHDMEATKLALLLESNQSIVEAVERGYFNTQAFADAVSNAVSQLKIEAPKVDAPIVSVNVPDVHVPEIVLPQFNFPEIVIPPIVVPEPKVTVNVPEQKAPIVNVEAPIVNFPDKMDATLEYTSKNPLPVISVDPAGNFVNPVAGGGGARRVKIDNTASEPIPITGNISASFSADFGSGEIGSQTLRTVQATDAIASVYVTGANGTIGVVTINPDGLPVDITAGVDVQFGPGTIDSFGHLVTGTINNQVDIQFYRGNGSVGDLVTETNTNGGTAAATGGMATFSATTTAGSRAKGVSAATTTYTAGGEIYCIFTAGWTGTGAGTSYQRLGIYDDNDGFYISKEANTFGVSVRKGGSDVFVSTFSEDALTGAADSLFTRAGVPEAVNLTKLNVWRIRFGWVGSAPINFEVLAPDGHWVTFHKILQPNNASFPHIEGADLPVTCDVFSGNSGNALTIITNCWAAGTTQALGKVNATITGESFASLSRSVITGETTAGGGGFVNVKVDPSGAVNVAGTVAVTLPNEGQQTMANSISVAIASNQTGVPVTNAGTFAVQSTNQENSGVDIGDVTINNAAGASAVNIQDGGNTITVDGTVAVSGTTTTKELRATTGTNTSVSDTATSATILASNANRLGATVYNDSSATLYLLLGSTAASATNYTCRVASMGYYEVPFGYTGQLTGIWATDPGDGAARVTEIT